MMDTAERSQVSAHRVAQVIPWWCIGCPLREGRCHVLIGMENRIVDYSGQRARLTTLAKNRET